MEAAAMKQKTRIIIAIIIIAAFAFGILAVESLRRGGSLYRSFMPDRFDGACVPVYRTSKELGRFCDADSSKLKKFGFTDKSERKLQEGWFLCDIILLYAAEKDLAPGTKIIVTSASRNKNAELTWRDVSDRKNMIILAMSKQGRLKLVSIMEGLDYREQWVQDVTRIEVSR
jgi:hypothetical protein